MHINRLVERFLREQQLPPTTFSRRAAHDPRLVFDMRMGREIGPEVEMKLRQFIAAHSRNQQATRSEAA